jgi:hypothetical protein
LSAGNKGLSNIDWSLGMDFNLDKWHVTIQKSMVVPKAHLEEFSVFCGGPL